MTTKESYDSIYVSMSQKEIYLNNESKKIGMSHGVRI